MKAKAGFTLIEVIVSVSILSMIAMSIFTVFSLSADLNNKIDISRSMQENIKNIEQTISQDVISNGITGVNSDMIAGNCGLSTTSKYSLGTKLCVGNSSYYLAKKVSGVWVRVGDYGECENQLVDCYLVRDDGTRVTQLSNSWIDFKSLYFYVTNTKVKKVTITFDVQPSPNKGIKPHLIKENKINYQVTISERLYNN